MRVMSGLRNSPAIQSIAVGGRGLSYPFGQQMHQERAPVYLDLDIEP